MRLRTLALREWRLKAGDQCPQTKVRGTGDEAGANLFQCKTPPVLAAPFSDHVEDQREQHAQKDGSRKREVEGGVLSAINDVPRKAAQRQVQAPHKEERDASQDQRAAENNQELAKIRHD